MADVAVGWRLIDGAIAARRRLRLDRLGRIRPYLMLVPALVLVTLLAFGLGYLLWLSVHAFDTFSLKTGPPSLEQYRRLFAPPTGMFYQEVMLRTFGVAVTVTAVAVVAGLPIAYFIVRTRSRAARAASLLLLLVPYLMGEIPRTFGWSLILGRQGAGSWLLSLVGVRSGGILGSVQAVWIGMLEVGIPFAALTILPAMRRIPPDLERAAQTLGARPWRIWWHVIVPLARPGIFGAIAIVLLLNIAEFDMPAILGLGRLPFAANVIQAIFLRQYNPAFGSAFTWILLVLAIVVVLACVALSGVRERR